MNCVRFATLFLAVFPVFGQTPDAATLAGALVGAFDSVTWGAPYSAAKACRRFSGSVEGQALTAPGEWSWHCERESGAISTESYYYAFPGAPALARVDIGLAGAAAGSSAAVRPLVEAKLTARFGAPSPEAPLYPLSPAGGVRALQWHTKEADLLLFDGAFYLSPLRPRTGVRLIAIGPQLRDAIRDDAKMPNLFDFGLPRPAQERLARELGSLYETPGATPGGVLRILRAARAANGERAAAMLLGADEMVFQLSVALGDDRHAAEAEAARRQLAAFAVRLGPQRKDGLAYDRDLLWQAWRKYPNTQWGQYAFLMLQQFGWNTSFDGYSCPANPDYFRDVIARGQEFAARYPNSVVRPEVLFAVATAYETWWSVSQAPPGDENYGRYPRRAENDRLRESARMKAIAGYAQIERLAPGSPYALFAARHLPRLRLDLDTGFRRWFCIGD